MSAAATEEKKSFLGRAGDSLTAGGDMRWRALIAIVVIGLTFLMTAGEAKIPPEWEAIFLLVIGYYFKERPQEGQLAARRMVSPGREPSSVETARILGEMTYQFLLAAFLIAGAAGCFLLPQPKMEIATAWIGGVMLAVAFYFKEGLIEILDDERRKFRRLLVLEVMLATAVIVVLLVGKKSGTVPVPTQWAAVVLIVVGFYFKEKEPKPAMPDKP